MAFIWKRGSKTKRSASCDHRRDAGRQEGAGRFTDGVRESAESWRELLLDLKRRGLSTAPELAVVNGALGFWEALGEVWPTTREQRCWVGPLKKQRRPDLCGG
jgi:Transposase, Mutator family